MKKFKIILMFCLLWVCVQYTATAQNYSKAYSVSVIESYGGEVYDYEPFIISGSDSYCESNDIGGETVYVDDECLIELCNGDMSIYSVADDLSFDDFYKYYYSNSKKRPYAILEKNSRSYSETAVLTAGTYIVNVSLGGDGAMLRIVVGNNAATNKRFKVGDVIGCVMETDITAKINGYSIPSYNVDGYTYIIAEDLNHYGFNVIYEESTRRLMIAREFLKTEVSKDYNKPYIEPYRVGRKSHDILFTDIETYVEGKMVIGYNISGQTIVRFDELGLYGDVTYDDTTRTISLRLPGLKLKGSDKAEPVYRIFFDANGAAVTNVPKNLANFTGDFTIPTDNIPFRNHYKFLGYSTNMNAESGEYQPGTKLCINSDMTLYAIWKSEYTYNIEKVVFSIIDGTNPDSKLGDSGDKYWREVTGNSTLGGWCAAYVTWLINEVHVGWDSRANIKTHPPTQMKCFVDNGCFHKKDSGYVPKTGDIIFFSKNGSYADHVAMVVIDDGEIRHLNGNISDKVKYLGDKDVWTEGPRREFGDYILGYGDMETLLHTMDPS